MRHNVRLTAYWLAGLTLSGLGTVAGAEGTSACDLRLSASGAQVSDFNDPASASMVRLIEANHFTPEVENLVSGKTAPLPVDIDFVLRHIPNHYRALSSMGRWQAKNKLLGELASKVQPADCYFQRAIAFRSDDASLHLAYAVYLHQAKRLTDAALEYAQAEALGASGAEFYYNRGLLAIDQGEIAKAREYAKKAYGLGYPLPGLRNRLDRYRGD